MARVPSDAKAVHDIISQLEGLEPEGLAEIAAKAQEVRQSKLTAKREEFIARMREEAAQLDLAPAALATRLCRLRPAAQRRESEEMVCYPPNTATKTVRGQEGGRPHHGLLSLKLKVRIASNSGWDAGGNGEGSAG